MTNPSPTTACISLTFRRAALTGDQRTLLSDVLIQGLIGRTLGTHRTCLFSQLHTYLSVREINKLCPRPLEERRLLFQDLKQTLVARVLSEFPLKNGGEVQRGHVKLSLHGLSPSPPLERHEYGRHDDGHQYGLGSRIWMASDRVCHPSRRSLALGTK